MTRIGKPSGVPEFGKGFQGPKKISPELQRNIRTTENVARKSHLHQFESTDSTFSKEPFGPFEKINTFVNG